MHRLERYYAAQGDDKLGELLRLRRAELDSLAALGATAGGAAYANDRAALTVDLAALATRDRRPDAEIAELYRAALAADSRHRLALLHLESMTRRAGASAELADIEERIASYFEGDPRSQAAFWTRAGETLAELGQIDAAVQRFTKADAAAPGNEFALEGWRHAALKGQLWIDVAEAASRHANAARTTDAERAALHHLAGVALMDKALSGAGRSPPPPPSPASCPPGSPIFPNPPPCPRRVPSCIESPALRGSSRIRPPPMPTAAHWRRRRRAFASSPSGAPRKGATSCSSPLPTRKASRSSIV